MTTPHDLPPHHESDADHSVKNYAEAYALAAIAPYKEENDKLRELLQQARSIVELAATIKLNDGTYFDKDCACTLFIAALKDQP
jgi:hypothetical protein